MRNTVLVFLFALAGCATPAPQVEVVPLAGDPQPAIAVEDVRFVEPAPEGCTSVARLTARSADGDAAQTALRARAAELGANVLVLSVADGGALDVLGTSVPLTQYSALALRCP